MRRIKNIFQAGIAVILLTSLLVVRLPRTTQADVGSTPSLVISQLKITSSNGQFITLYNSTNASLDASKYQLEYFNSYDLTKATSSRLIALSGTIPPHGYFMVNDDSLLLCYQLAVDSVSLGLSSTAGLVEVLASSQNSPGGSVVPVLHDYVGWSKTSAAGAQTLPTATNGFLERQPNDAQNNPIVLTPGSGSWQSVQPDTNNPCRLVSVTNASTIIPTGLSQLLPGSEPPATIVSIAADSSGQTASAGLPSGDIGLMAPSVTELLPNPAGTGNDGSDEFIELYNSNFRTFDLSGFALQTGTTTLHKFIFPAGTSLPAHGFAAFYSSTTGLSLSNSGSQSKLLDPFGNSISASGVYGTAKDGQSWALAKGKWYWTVNPTPGKANIIKQPVNGKKSTAKKSGKVKAANTAKHTSGNNSGSASGSDAASLTPIHPWTLAMVGGLALLYGGYEYRADMANHFNQLKRHFKTRRDSRS